MRDAILADFLRDRGKATRLAEALKITPAAVYQWERVPVLKVAAVEEFTGIPRHEWRPDIFEAPSAQGSAA